MQVVCICTYKVNGLIPGINEHKVWDAIELSSLKGRNTYIARCINVDSMQEVTDSLHQTISRCFQQLHFLYWWRGWRSNASSTLIPKNCPVIHLVIFNTQWYRVQPTVCWCDVFKHIVVKCVIQTKFPCNVL